MFSRMLAGLGAVLFVIFIERRGSAAEQCKQRCLITAVLLTLVLTISLAPRNALSAADLSNSVEASAA